MSLENGIPKIERWFPINFEKLRGIPINSHPITEQHLNTLKSWGITIIPPQTKKLFCGTYGLGAMANVEDIIDSICSLSK